MGLLALVDEESKFPQATNATMVHKLTKNLNSNTHYIPTRGQADTSFAIKHYAGVREEKKKKKKKKKRKIKEIEKDEEKRMENKKVVEEKKERMKKRQKGRKQGRKEGRKKERKETENRRKG